MKDKNLYEHTVNELENILESLKKSVIALESDISYKNTNNEASHSEKEIEKLLHSLSEVQKNIDTLTQSEF